MLSLILGTPIAKIKGGALNGQTLHIYNPPEEKSTYKLNDPGLKVSDDRDIKRLIIESMTERDQEKLTPDDIAYLLLPDEEKRVLVGKEAIHLNPFLKKIKKLIPEFLRKEIYLPDSVIEPIMNTNKHEYYAVFGPSGAGKSYYIGKMLERVREEEHEIMKKNKDYEPKTIFIFTRVGSDESFDEKKLAPFIRINATDPDTIEELIETNPSPEMFKDSIVIFDDISTIPNKEANKIIRTLSDGILETGRHQNINGLWTNHIIRDKNNTKHMHNEATSLTFFPQSNKNSILTYFKDVCAFTKKDIDKLERAADKSRWLTLLRTYPNCVLYEHGAYLV
jgi:hypothetical protein